MARFLIIYAHPNHDGYHAYFLNQAIADLERRGIAYQLIDLYAINYDPVLKNDELYSAGRRAISEQNQAFQKQVIEADRLLFIYPTWWNNLPAILKGWLDRVFVSRFGFIYKLGIPVGQLHGKKAAIFTARGAPRWYSLLWTHERSLRALSHDVLRFCGMSTRGFRFGSTRTLDDRGRRKIAKIAARTIRYLVA